MNDLRTLANRKTTGKQQPTSSRHRRSNESYLYPETHNLVFGHFCIAVAINYLSPLASFRSRPLRRPSQWPAYLRGILTPRRTPPHVEPIHIRQIIIHPLHRHIVRSQHRHQGIHKRRSHDPANVAHFGGAAREDQGEGLARAGEEVVARFAGKVDVLAVGGVGGLGGDAGEATVWGGEERLGLAGWLACGGLGGGCG